MLYHLMLFLHLMTASAWVGGILFIPLVLIPLLKNHPDRKTLIIRAGKIFDRVSFFILLPVILITGLLIAWDQNMLVIPSVFARKIMEKVILFAVMVLIQLYHNRVIGPAIERAVNNEEEYRRLSRWSSWSGRIVLIISLLMLYLCMSIR